MTKARNNLILVFRVILLNLNNGFSVDEVCATLEKTSFFR